MEQRNASLAKIIVQDKSKSEPPKLLAAMPNVSFEYIIPQLTKEQKEEQARKEAIQQAYKEWKKAQAEKDSAVTQIDGVEEAYRSWVQAKRDKEIVLQQIQKEALELEIQKKEREINF